MLEQIAYIFKINNGLVARALEGLSDDEVWQAPVGGGNSIGWILGHITETRTGLLYAFGRRIEGGWSGRRFSRGSTPEDPASYPSRAEIEARWKATHGAMRDVFAAFTAEQLAAPATAQLPGATTMADQTAFLAFHESYHVGQLAFIRKQNGHSAIAG